MPREVVVELAAPQSAQNAQNAQNDRADERLTDLGDRAVLRQLAGPDRAREAGFVFSDSIIIRSLGFGLAADVLIDAFVVRLLLMPAVMHLLGRCAWWLPRWLDRILPNVDVEGAALERRHHLLP